MCCGCSACKNICPKNAITMIEDEEGFLYPTVDNNLCVECHACEKVCPILNCKEEVKVQQEGYLIRHKDENVLKQSTSGGAFTAFCQVVLRQNGVVFGAAFDENYEVHHISVEKEEELYKFRNSKYVQSDLEETYRKCREFVSAGRLVLFSGTPCQIEGLICYLGVLSDKVIKVDVVCRSVPSRLVWRKYKNLRNVNNAKLHPEGFRNKDKYGYEYSQMKFCDDTKSYYSGVESDPYLRAFFSDLSVRPSCYSCKFKKRYRVSDITLWDCFNPSKFDKTFDDNKGVTRCLVHSKKGFELIEQAKEFSVIQSIDPDKLVQGVREMVSSVNMHPRRSEFFRDVAIMEDKELFAKYFPDSIKIKLKRFVRRTCWKLGIYRSCKRVAKKLLRK
jgi:Fe-S-cluster-containing hydrogenase component 2